MSSPSADSQRDLETQPLNATTQASDTRGLKRGLFDIGREEAETVICLIVWMLLSSIVIIYNKWLFTSGGFPYPLALTSMHMTCCFVVFGAIRKFAPRPVRVAIMPDADVQTTWPEYFKGFASISVFYAGALGFGNLAYVFSSITFIQMMKPMNCIWASLVCFALGIEHPTWSHFVIVCVVACGVIVATTHQTVFSVAGCLLQIASSISEGCRLGLMQKATNTGVKLDPVTTVYNFSFASAVLLSCACFAMEWPLNLSKLYSPWVLVVNCAMAIVLNILVATVIKKTSAVTFTLGGVIKDIGLVVASSVLFQTQVTHLMVGGYSISICGLIMFKAYKDNLTVFKERGFLGGMSFAIRSGKKN